MPGTVRRPRHGQIANASAAPWWLAPRLLRACRYLFASIAVWWGLCNVMDHGWAALIVTAVWDNVCAVLYVASKRPASTPSPTNER
jgi:hypothetical protein